jgi:hypothetical protein
MAETSDQAVETLILEGWAARSLRPADLQASDDPQMHGLVAIVRLALSQSARLEQRAEQVEQQLAELERRVRQLEARVGIGRTLQ